MKTEILPKGLWPVMITPFDEHNRVDVKLLKELTEFFIESGVNGLFANCLSSEMYQLSNDERVLYTKTTISAAKGRVPVVSSGIFSREQNTNIDFIKKIADTGVAAVIINTNQLNDCFESENDFKQKLEILINRTGNINLGLYECPDPYKRLVSPELMKWLARTGRFRYFKDTCCNLPAIERKVEAIKDSIFGLYNANMPTGIDSMKRGARGISPIGANYFPELYAYLVKNYENKALESEMNSLNALLNILDPIIHRNYPLSAKIFLQKRGMKIGATTRASVGSLCYQDYVLLDSLMTVFRDTAEKYEISTSQF